MRTAISKAGRPAYYTVREAAWILGVEPSRVSRTIRLGTLRTRRRRGRLMVPASALIRLLAERTDTRADNDTKPRAARGQPSWTSRADGSANPRTQPTPGLGQPPGSAIRAARRLTASSQ